MQWGNGFILYAIPDAKVHPHPANLTTYTNAGGGQEDIHFNDAEIFGIGALVNVLLLLICLVGADMFSKSTFIIFLIIIGITVGFVFEMLFRSPMEVCKAPRSCITTSYYKRVTTSNK